MFVGLNELLGVTVEKPEQVRGAPGEGCIGLRLFLRFRRGKVERQKTGDGSNLKGLYEYVQKALSPGAEDGAGDSWKPPVLIVDNLGVLLSLGGNLVVMVHSSDDSEDEENELLAKSLRHQSNRILWAQGLATGYCKDVHGELTIIQRSSWETKAERDLSCVYQYKIQDKNVLFFARGMSAAVL
ncbi:hypothetical protein JD844_003812 [Phrynosoma platyrhinos]|uniref:Elongator complex protein 6 n=1 Tax=Phrynosoma platyrhinos TaxID=52577 RepID=A0ABQ7TDW3_PHRPL|nr:hypothetical protein JD844_003812 [Phrynosoma platyrhinos]